MTRPTTPRWTRSIRFRLALAYSLAVFAAGATLLAGVYLWQLNRLNSPIVVRTTPILREDPATGELVNTRWRALLQSEVDRAILESLERQVYAESLDQLRIGSLLGLGLVSLVAFGSGWLLSGWTLGPMGRMAAVAREISGAELSRRIALQGPDDELKDLADTFDAMLDRLESSFEGQRRFVQDASHELRNPLAVARANLELALDDPDATAADLRRSAHIALESTGRISQIVEDLVNQARDAVPVVASVPVELGALAAEVATDMAATAAGRHLTVRAEGPAVVVHGDPSALRRAVTNLVANAVRLAPTGTIILLSTAERDARWGVLSVADEGPGIEPEHQQAVFERFWRGDAAGKGLGLGLSIVRQVVERHGGHVELVSSPGCGSTFTLVLPLPVGPPAAGGPLPSLSAPWVR